MVIASAYAVPAAMALLPTSSVMVSCLEPGAQLVEAMVIPPLHVAAGVSKLHPDWVVLLRSGMTSSTFPSAGTSPAVVNETVAVLDTPGVGVAPESANVLAPVRSAAEANQIWHTSMALRSATRKTPPTLREGIAMNARQSYATLLDHGEVLLELGLDRE